MPLSQQERGEINRLFAEFRETKNVELMQEIAQRSQGLVGYTIRTYFSASARHSDRDDYFQEGCLALIYAINFWDEQKGNFEGYAIKTIYGRLIQFSCRLATGWLGITSGEREKFVSLRKKYLPLQAANLPLWYICEQLDIDRQGLFELEYYLVATKHIRLGACRDPEKIAASRRNFEEEMLAIFEGAQEERNYSAEIEAALLELPISERDRQIFAKRFGLLGFLRTPLADISAEYGVQSVRQTIHLVYEQMKKILEIRQAKDWLKSKIIELPLSFRRVFTARYGLDGLPPMGHLAIAKHFGLGQKTSIQYIKLGWKRLADDPQAQKIRAVLWWKDI